MSYTVKFTSGARKELHKLDKYTAALILGWIEKNLNANLQGQWRYRVGNYRLLAQIDDGEVTILMLKIGHRKEVYK